ncbi:MAG: hypothetical protein ACI32N_05610 [Bulleidia sp.]
MYRKKQHIHYAIQTNGILLDEGIRTPYTLTPKRYETFFPGLFDLWYA